MMAHDRTKFSESGEESLSSEEESDDEFDHNDSDSDDDAKKRGFIAKKVPSKSRQGAERNSQDAYGTGRQHVGV